MSEQRLSDASIIASRPAMAYWFNLYLVWDVTLTPNPCLVFGAKDKLFEGILRGGSIDADLSVVIAMT